MLTDHINGDGLDNRRNNLRNATPVINARNVTRMFRRNRSGYVGVRLDEYGHWVAQLSIHRKNYIIGRFADRIDAIQAAARFREHAYAP